MNRSLAVLALVAAALTPEADAQVLLSKTCETVWQGHLIRGSYQIERQIYYDTHRVYGTFATTRTT